MGRLCIAVFLLSGLALDGAELSIPKATVTKSGTATVEIRFAAQGSQVVAFQVDLQYDTQYLKVSASAGPAATSREKLIGSSEVAPGRKRILLMGFNQSVLADGVVVSLLVSSVSSEPGTYWLRLTDAIATDKDGHSLSLATIDGAVSVASEGGMPQASTIAQVACGGWWKTMLTLVNISSAPANAKLNFWGDQGQPLVLPLKFAGNISPTTASSLERSLEPAAMLVVELEAPEASETFAGWAELQSSASILGYAVLRTKNGSGKDTEAMLVFEQHKGQALFLPYDNTSSFQTGIAIANQSAESPATVTLVLRDDMGAVIWTETLPLPIRGHISFAATERFPALSGRRGTIEMQSNSTDGIAALALRFNPTGSFTSIPVTSK